MNASKKAHHELGLEPYLLIAGILGLIAAFSKSIWQKLFRNK
jgi:hypothetical protein